MIMVYGYAGKLLFVDLTAGTIVEETPAEDFYRACIGGTGLGAKVIMERTQAGIDPLGPTNMLGFVAGPLTATGVYGGGRFMVTTKSPLTGGWADSNSGGTWGPELKEAGYDGVFVTGVSNRPVCLVIDAGEARLVDAEAAWGKDTYEADDVLQELTGRAGQLDHLHDRARRRAVLAPGRHRQREGEDRGPFGRGGRDGLEETEGGCRACGQGQPHPGGRQGGAEGDPEAVPGGHQGQSLP